MRNYSPLPLEFGVYVFVGLSVGIALYFMWGVIIAPALGPLVAVVFFIFKRLLFKRK